jgi:phage shock protein A
MGIFKRSQDIVQAKVNKGLDKMERPDEILDLSYEKMLEQITKVRKALVDVAAARRRIELQEDQLQASIDRLQEQARAALAHNREDLAREALSRKSVIQTQIDQMEPQHQQLTDQEAHLTQTLQALTARVNAFRTQKETLKAQYSAAKATSQVNENLAGIGSSFNDAGAALQRAQDKIASMQARSGALDELMASGALEDLRGNSDDIQHELDKISAQSDVDRELAAMRAELGTGQATTALPGASVPTEALPAGTGQATPAPSAQTAEPAEGQTEA